MTDPDRIDELLAHLPPPPPLSEMQVARIRTRIPVTRSRAHPVGRRFALVAVLGIVLAVSAVLAMYLLDAHRRDPEVMPPPPPAPPLPPPSPPPTRLTARDDVQPAPVVAVAPVAPRAASVTAPARVAPRAASVPAPAKTQESPKPPAVTEDRESALGAESKLLAMAIRQLRGKHDPRAALATLDDHDARFPHGALGAEVRAARVEALVALGDRRGALALLDAGPVKGEQAVLRGELRLDAGRAEEAVRDFESALIGTTDKLEQRALYGRAAARVRLGDPAGARRDLEDYLRRFPRGASAAAARAALEKIR
jgi:TolA-binding protein